MIDKILSAGSSLDLFSQASTFLRDLANPDAAFFRVADVGPAELRKYLRRCSVQVWGVYWTGDHTVFRCQRSQAGYVVELLRDYSYTTNYQPQPTRRNYVQPRAKQSLLRRLW